MTKEYENIVSTHALYNDNIKQWEYLRSSYIGGSEYRKGKHLTRYVAESDVEYEARLKSTYLDNHCQSTVSVYNSFLFREAPKREFGQLANLPETQAFIKDADLDGRSLNNFMKELATWASIYGHCWALVVKPNTNANTRADELLQEVRPYINLMTPLSVLDWGFERKANGVYSLNYLKYIESSENGIDAIKEWTIDEITTYVVDTMEQTVIEEITELNGLDIIPAVVLYNKRSENRNIGISDILDIADAQRFIFNCNSEIEQSVRLESHPSLVITSESEAGIGAGSLIYMDDNLDPALKPYVLDFDGASVVSILQTIEQVTNAIDMMANTGSIRGTESKTMSGIAMQTEFELLGAKLAEKADNLELAEEQIWRLFALYLGRAWDGEVAYPGSFNIQDTQNEFAQLVSANSATENPLVKALIDRKIVELLGADPDSIL